MIWYLIITAILLLLIIWITTKVKEHMRTKTYKKLLNSTNKPPPRYSPPSAINKHVN